MTATAISTKTCFYLFAALFTAYFIGLWVPFMDEDAAHHANIALHMYLTGDYVSLIDRGTDYLDKPHLHFWLAALSYSVFGVTTIAYKLPSFLITVLSVYAVWRLGKRLYDTETGRMAALIYASAQAEILALNDVRMDALLTASVAIAIWQLVDFVYTKRRSNLFFGALFTAAAFATKGMIGLATPGIAVFFLLVYQRNWAMLFNWQWFDFGLLFLLFISPVVYCYYLQFDLHPEKVIRGTSGHSGVKFILWDQNTERLEGSKWGKGHRDYFFFFHTLLWAFLPWCLLFYMAFFQKAADFFKARFKPKPHLELAMPGVIVVIFAIISASGYQLPHYLNVLFPAFAVLTGAYLVHSSHRDPQSGLIRFLSGLQYFVIAVCMIIILIVSIWCFPVTNVVVVLLSLLVFGLMMFISIKKKTGIVRLVSLSVLTMVFVNILLNGSFYPKLVRYQAGFVLSQNQVVRKIPPQNVFFYKEHSYCFDFYLRNLHPVIDVTAIKKQLQTNRAVWVFTREEFIPELRHSGLKTGKVIATKNYGVTRLRAGFLNPETRPQMLNTEMLVEIRK